MKCVSVAATMLLVTHGPHAVPKVAPSINVETSLAVGRRTISVANDRVILRSPRFANPQQVARISSTLMSCTIHSGIENRLVVSPAVITSRDTPTLNTHQATKSWAANMPVQN